MGPSFRLEISLSPLETEGETLVSSAIRDISERKTSGAEVFDSFSKPPPTRWW